MKLTKFRDILNSVSSEVKIYHEIPLKEEGKYVVWSETGMRMLFSNSRGSEMVHTIRVHYFTDKEYDEIPYLMQDVFDDNGIAYSKCKIEYINEISYWAYTWEVEA